MSEPQPRSEPQSQPMTTSSPAAPTLSAGPAATPYQAFDPRHKSPILASLLSFMPGLGQVYVGYYNRGFAHAMVVATLIALLASNQIDDIAPFIGIFLAFFMLYNIIDAGRRAAFYNQALSEGESFEPIQLPGDAGGLGPQANLVGGVMLMAAGSALLLHTRFDVSLDWVQDWWPAAPMVLGLYMIFLAIQERRGLLGADVEMPHESA